MVDGMSVLQSKTLPRRPPQWGPETNPQRLIHSKGRKSPVRAQTGVMLSDPAGPRTVGYVFWGRAGISSGGWGIGHNLTSSGTEFI